MKKTGIVVSFSATIYAIFRQPNYFGGLVTSFVISTKITFKFYLTLCCRGTFVSRLIEQCVFSARLENKNESDKVVIKN